MRVNLSRSSLYGRNALQELGRLTAIQSEGVYMMKLPPNDAHWDTMVVDRRIEPDMGQLMLLGDDQGFRLARHKGGPRPSELWGVVTWLFRRP